MEAIASRGRGLLRAQLSRARSRWATLAASHQRLLFSCSAHFTANPERQSLLANRPLRPDTPCRTRFAPSPTGYLHLGSLRTALFNYLLARATGGQFVLRIEDTDQSRLVADAEEKLIEGLKWAGLSWDEGPDTQGPYGPYRQSERLPLYKEHADMLIREGKAYRCFCSPEQLEQHKRDLYQLGQPMVYPGVCRTISHEESDERAAKGEQFAVRFKSAETPTVIQDVVYGRFMNKHPEHDYIIVKRDGYPTYHFANVVDDRHMKITHVIRGAEWLISTPKHVELYNAFGWEPPTFAHVGLLVDNKRQKLSKRDNTADLTWYQQNHVLPIALLNFAVLLGWRGRQGKKDVMSLEDMIESFTLQFSKGDIVVPMQKLSYLQNQHLERLIDEKKPGHEAFIEANVIEPIKAFAEEVETARKVGAIMPGGIPEKYLGEPLPAIQIFKERFYPGVVRTILGVKMDVEDPHQRFRFCVSKLKYYIWELPRRILKATFEEAQRFSEASQPDEALAALREKISAVSEEDWTHEKLEKLLRATITEGEISGIAVNDKQKATYKLLRWALVASEQGLPIAWTMEILGRDLTLQRLDAARSVAEELITAQRRAARRAQATVAQTAQGAAQQPAQTDAAQPAEGAVVQPAEGVAAQPAEGVVAPATEGVAAPPAEEVAAQPAEGVVAQPAEEVAAPPAEGVAEKRGQDDAVQSAQSGTAQPPQNDAAEKPAQDDTAQAAQSDAETPAQ